MGAPRKSVSQPPRVRPNRHFYVMLSGILCRQCACLRRSRPARGGTGQNVLSSPGPVPGENRRFVAAGGYSFFSFSDTCPTISLFTMRYSPREFRSSRTSSLAHIRVLCFTPCGDLLQSADLSASLNGDAGRALIALPVSPSFRVPPNRHFYVMLSGIGRPHALSPTPAR